MTKRDRPDRPMPIGNTEPCSHGILVFELAKEACTERKALYSDQHVLYRCTPIDPPIRDGPRLRALSKACLLYTSPSPRDRQKSRMPSSA